MEEEEEGEEEDEEPEGEEERESSPDPPRAPVSRRRSETFVRHVGEKIEIFCSIARPLQRRRRIHCYASSVFAWRSLARCCCCRCCSVAPPLRQIFDPEVFVDLGEVRHGELNETGLVSIRVPVFEQRAFVCCCRCRCSSVLNYRRVEEEEEDEEPEEEEEEAFLFDPSKASVSRRWSGSFTQGGM